MKCKEKGQKVVAKLCDSFSEKLPLIVNSLYFKVVAL